jgi:uncharacterized protein with PIN domain
VSEVREDAPRCPECNALMQFYEPEPRTPGDYTGYLERCEGCGLVQQIPQ